MRFRSDRRKLRAIGPALGYVVNMLIAWAGPTCMRRLRTEFPQPVFDGERVEAGGVVREVVQRDGETLAVCDVWLDKQDGTRTVSAQAWVALPSEHGINGTTPPRSP